MIPVAALEPEALWMLRDTRGDPIRLTPLPEERRMRRQGVCQALRDRRRPGPWPFLPARGKVRV